MGQLEWKKHHQCKLQATTAMSAGEVFVLVDDKKTPPMQVAGDDHHECNYAYALVDN